MLKLVNWFSCQKESNSILKPKGSLQRNRYFFVTIKAQIVKQNKIKEKKELGKTKGKGFDKTSDNWKAASEDFRSAIKAIKKEEK